MSTTPASTQEGTPAGGTPVSPPTPSPSRPPNPTMGTCEETYPGSGSYYYVFGGKPKADWSGIEDPSSRTMSDLCFRSLDPVAGQKSSHYRTKPLSTKFDVKKSITDFQADVWEHLCKHGLDTITYLPDPRNTTTEVLCTVTKHAQLTGDMTVVEKLSQDTFKKFDLWDRKNDSEAKSFLLGSLSETLRKDFKPFHDREKDCFTTTWLRLIHFLVTSNSRTFDKLKDDIRSIRPQQYGGQNIEKMASAYIEKCDELTNAGYFEVSLILNIVDGFLCASQDTKGTFHFNMNQLRSKIETMQKTTVFSTREEQIVKYANARLSFKDVCFEAVKDYKTLCDNNQWEPKKLPKDRQGPSSHSAQLAVINKVNNLIANMSKNGGSNQSKESGSGGNNDSKNKRGKRSNKITCYNCGKPGHTSRECPEPKKTPEQKKAIRHKNLAAWRLKAPNSGESHTKTVDGRKFHWCDKCGNWTSTHTAQTHGGKSRGSGSTKKGGKKSDFSPETNLTLFEPLDPELWLVQFDEEEKQQSFSLFTLIKYFYLVLTVGILLGLPIASFIVIIERLSENQDLWSLATAVWLSSLRVLWEKIKLLQFVIGPLMWIGVGYVSTKLPTLLKPKFDPVLLTPEPRHRRRHDKSQSKSLKLKQTKLKSARDYNLTPKYPLRLRKEQRYNTRSTAPSFDERNMQEQVHNWRQACAYPSRYFNASGPNVITPSPRNNSFTRNYNYSSPRSHQKRKRHEPIPGQSNITTFFTPQSKQRKGGSVAQRKQKYKPQFKSGPSQKLYKKNFCTSKVPENCNCSFCIRKSINDTFYQPVPCDVKPAYVHRKVYNPVGLPTKRDSPNLNMTSKQHKKLKKVAKSVLMLNANVHSGARAAAQAVSRITPSCFRLALMAEKKESQFPIVWDSGASICISPDKNDFVSYNASSRTVRGVGNTNPKVIGVGEISWSIYDVNGSLRKFKLPAYHIPDCKVRLISTTALIDAYRGESITIEGSTLKLSGRAGDRTRSPVVAFNNPVTNLPTSRGYASRDTEIPGNSLFNTMTSVSENNHNLSEAQKELLRWHQRLGHLDFNKVKHLLRTGVLSHTEGTRSLHTAASKIEHVPKCAACLFGKQTIRTAPGKVVRVIRDRTGVSKSGNLLPGQEVSVDHFISSVRGRLFEGFNKGRIEDRFVGGCIFVDHASSYIHVEFQSSLSSHETLSAKMEYEKHCRDVGVVPQKFISDNGKSFASKEFSEHLSNFYQISRFAGVGAHHHNAIAERAIRTIMSIARTMMIHSGICWPDVADSTLWPMAVKQACFLYNHVPSHTTGLSPSDLFTRVRWPQKKFLDLHVWGCPVYVLEKSLQDGKKIPKWKPRSRRSIYVGISHKHASTVPLVLNTSTGAITPQFHVVFDDWFATVGSDHSKGPDFSAQEWSEMFGKSRYQYITDDKEEDEKPEQDLYDTLKSQFKADKIAEAQEKASPTQPLNVDEPVGKLTRQIQQGYQPIEAPVASPTKAALPTPSSGNDREREESPVTFEPPDSEEESPAERKTPSPRKRTVAKRKVGIERLDLGPRRSRRSVKAPENFTYDHSKNSLTGKPVSFVTEEISDSRIHIHFVTPDCYVLLAASKENNPDLFSFDDAMKSEQRSEWIKAAIKEITALEALGCWTEVPLESATTKVLPGTWVFKVKRAPDGSFKKFKARYCIRGDLQEGEFETYAPVVQFASVRLFLAWSLMFNWYTCSVDFSNAFIQATLKDDTFIHLPRGFRQSGNQRTCLKLRKSLYGLAVAPRLWYQHLWKALKELGLEASKHDPCLLFRKDLIVICYVDDLGIQAPNKEIVDKLIDQLRKKGFDLTFEGTFSEYLGIKYTKIGKNEIKMTQEGLIKKIMDATGMNDCNSNRTPTTKEALGSDEQGEPMQDEWNYRSIVGMMLYLSTNTRPDIAFAVSQVARFSHRPRKSHATAVKTIVRYLAGSLDQGVVYKRPETLSLDCFVDADFAGLYGRENPENPTCAKSRTGYIISIGGCYITCKSQLQTTIALSTSEAEYGALSSAMRVVIPLRETLLEMINAVDAVDSQRKRPFGTREDLRAFRTVIHEDNAAALSLAVNQKVTSRTKHWCVKFHFFWSYINDIKHNTSCVKVDTKSQRADYLTKGLTKENFERCRFMNQGW